MSGGNVTVLTPNHSEAGEIAGIEVDDIGSARKAAMALLELGPEQVCMRLADGGAILSEKSEFWLVPRHRV